MSALQVKGPNQISVFLKRGYLSPWKEESWFIYLVLKIKKIKEAGEWRQQEYCKKNFLIKLYLLYQARCFLHWAQNLHPDLDEWENTAPLSSLGFDVYYFLSYSKVGPQV